MTVTPPNIPSSLRSDGPPAWWAPPAPEPITSRVFGKNYVVGFVFDPAGLNVVLIRKNWPAWQKGKLNGVGGKIEPGERPIEAIQREFLEEADVVTLQKDWNLFAIMHSGDQDDPKVPGTTAIVHCYEMRNAHVFHEAYAVTDEKIEKITSFSAKTRPDIIPNLQVLIPLALNRDLFQRPTELVWAPSHT